MRFREPARASASRVPVSRAVRLAMAGVVAAAAPVTGALAADAGDQDLDTVYVSALAIREDARNVAAPFSIIDGDELFRESATTLGNALATLPGVHSDTFGGGASRPVIRGQAPPRVSVLSDGATLFDASSVSPDHAVTSEPLLTRRIEVLRGPATLLYGSGAIGGVVNVLDDRIPETTPDDIHDLDVGIRGNTALQERAIAAGLTLGYEDRFALRLEGFRREAGDYSVPDQEVDRFPGTFADSSGGTIGASFIGSRGFIGAAMTYRTDNYGLPGHAHEFEDCADAGGVLSCPPHDEEHEEEEEEAPPVIDLRNRRFDLRGELADPFAGFTRLRLRASHTNYDHDEIEEGEIATTFINEGYEARLEAEHRKVAGWTGVVGLQHSNVKSGAIGDEGFVPTTRNETTGLFVVEHFEPVDDWHFELGARKDWVRIRGTGEAAGLPGFSDGAFSVSGAAVWSFHPSYALSLSASRSERLPFSQELYARGLHLATNTFECGLFGAATTCGGAQNDRPLGTETSKNVELQLRRTEGPLTFSIGVFRNAIDDYIYARTLDAVESFRLVKYTQQDANFTGLEAEFGWRFNPVWSATVFGDTVRGKLDAGGNLPRISPQRLGLRVNGAAARFSGEAEFFHVARQDDIAAYELATPGYDMLNLSFGFTPGKDSGYRLFVRASNLLDETVFNHVSFLADRVPLPGRALSAGVQMSF
jgi:iron complex outermembrane recepter protein